jgi:hypothetical protein
MGDNVQTEHETAIQNSVSRFKRDIVSPDQHKYTTNDGDNVEFQNQKLYQKVCQAHRDSSPQSLLYNQIYR